MGLKELCLEEMNWDNFRNHGWSPSRLASASERVTTVYGAKFGVLR